jgi:hypothetical protein
LRLACRKHDLTDGIDPTRQEVTMANRKREVLGIKHGEDFVDEGGLGAGPSHEARLAGRNSKAARRVLNVPVLLILFRKCQYQQAM